jgi:hypothetical protein
MQDYQKLLELEYYGDYSGWMEWDLFKKIKFIISNKCFLN